MFVEEFKKFERAIRSNLYIRTVDTKRRLKALVVDESAKRVCLCFEDVRDTYGPFLDSLETEDQLQNWRAKDEYNIAVQIGGETSCLFVTSALEESLRFARGCISEIIDNVTADDRKKSEASSKRFVYLVTDPKRESCRAFWSMQRALDACDYCNARVSEQMGAMRYSIVRIRVEGDFPTDKCADVDCRHAWQNAPTLQDVIKRHVP